MLLNDSPVASVYPTVAEVLALDVVRQGKPRVVAGTPAALQTRVRSVHVSELADIAYLLTAVSWSSPSASPCPTSPRRYAGTSTSWPTSASSGSWWSWAAATPTRCPALVTAAAQRDLPLVELHREI